METGVNKNQGHNETGGDGLLADTSCGENVTDKGNDGVGNLSSSLLRSVDLEQSDIIHSKKSFL